MRPPRFVPLRPLVIALLVSTAAIPATPSTSAAQAAEDPPLYDRALDALIEADTMAAIEHLRRLTRERSDYAPGWGLLGRVLTARASGVETDLSDRVDAERAIRRALALEPNHPAYLATLGRLMRKQEMIVDARRMLNRAAERAEERPDALSAEERAELWFEIGLFAEDAYLDSRGLVYAPDLPVGGVCDPPVFCDNFERPKPFNAHLLRAADLSDSSEDEFERMRSAFGAALKAEPAHAPAFRRLAIHAIDRGELEDARRLAARFIEAAPHQPWGHLVLGLVYHRMAADSLAEETFARGLERAPAAVSAHYRDIRWILSEAQADAYGEANRRAREEIEALLWRKSDPLYLTQTNEIRTEHFARVTYADLMFEDPTTGSRGSETERGLIYVRYGPPKRIWQVRRDRSRETSTLDIMFGAEGRAVEAEGGGRWIFWNYGAEVPNFIFARSLRYRRARHLESSYSKAMEESLREALPATYSPSFTILEYPAQLARFRGDDPSTIELDVYSEIPVERLLADVRADSLDAGVFVFAGPEHQRVYERTLRVPAARSELPLTYTLPLPPGRYTIAAEARGAGAAAATRRDAVELEPPGPGLAASDLVLAYTVAARAADPVDRGDFAVRVNRGLEFEPGDPLALYWEVYGLDPDDDGLVRYRVTLGVRDAEGGGVLSRVVGALGGALGLGGDSEPELTYERVAEMREGRVPEYVSLELGTRERGRYVARVRITDAVTGSQVEIEREFTIGPT